ncbi:MAG: endolytic transglycosylase MltG [Burkholderiales bacterium]|nr:endolytic transglycosylase MltG [Burkholderiales bacterium]
MRMGPGWKVFLLPALIAIWAVYYLAIPYPISKAPLEFTLEQGSLKHAAKQMEDAGILGNSFAFVMLARIMGKSSAIKAGNYELDHPLTPLQLLDRITSGDFTQSGITVVEGWTFKELRKALEANPDLRHDSTGLPDADLLSRIGAAQSSPEGLFFPDTYYFAKGQSDISVLGRAYVMMTKKFEKEWEGRSAGLPFSSPYEALTLASIVEKETGKAADRPMIAAVFANRLKLGMKLQTDPTVIYGLGDSFDGNLRKKDLLTDQPYNTYTRVGLPPTPIAMPGLKSIDAVLHPAKSGVLYFVAKGDGSSVFSNSLAEHNRAVNRYQKK